MKPKREKKKSKTSIEYIKSLDAINLLVLWHFGMHIEHSAIDNYMPSQNISAPPSSSRIVKSGASYATQL